MRNKLIIISIAALCFGSCLKDKNIDDRLYGLDGIEDAKTVAILNESQSVISLNASATDTTFDLITVNANSKPAASDITVTFEEDNSLIDAYNDENGTSYVPIPSNLFSLGTSGLTVTIPKGSNTASLQVTIKPDNIVEGEYALAYRIAGVNSGNGYIANPNASGALVIIGVKNKYDGIYSLRIKTEGWAAYGIADGLTGDWPGNVYLITNGANKVTHYNDYTESFLQPAFTTGLAGATQFGAATPEFSFNVETNALTNVSNTTPDDGRGRAFALNPAVTDSRYDPDTRTIYAAYLMKQNGRPDQRIFDTLVYISPR